MIYKASANKALAEIAALRLCIVQNMDPERDPFFVLNTIICSILLLYNITVLAKAEAQTHLRLFYFLV